LARVAFCIQAMFSIINHRWSAGTGPRSQTDATVHRLYLSWSWTRRAYGGWFTYHCCRRRRMLFSWLPAVLRLLTRLILASPTA